MYNYKKWTGAFIRKAKELGLENPNFSELRKIYVYDALDTTSDFYLTMEEQMYVFLTKFFDEVKPQVEVAFKCPICDTENIMNFSKDDIVFQDADFQNINFEFEGKKYTFIMGEPISKDNLRELCDSIDKNVDKIYLEFIFSVNKIEVDGAPLDVPNIQEFLDGFLLEMPIKTHNAILRQFKEMRPSIKAFKDCECVDCTNVINVVLNDELPNTIIDELI